jgi:hypothetical protein
MQSAIALANFTFAPQIVLFFPISRSFQREEAPAAAVGLAAPAGSLSKLRSFCVGFDRRKRFAPIFRVICALGLEPAWGRPEQSWSLAVPQPRQDPHCFLVREI